MDSVQVFGAYEMWLRQLLTQGVSLASKTPRAVKPLCDRETDTTFSGLC